MADSRLRIHPLFIGLGIFYLAMGSGYLFLCYFVAVLFHEMAHYRMARLRGYRLGRIVLMPYGAVLKGGENYPRVDGVLIAIAGPIASLVMALFIIALWWLVPDLYAMTESLMYANLTLALFNIIPVFPLDGARVILALSHKKARTLRVLRVVGIVLSIVMILLMILSLFYTFNISLGITGLFLMHGAISGTDQEMYSHVMTVDNFHKSISYAITYLDMAVSVNSALYRLLECVHKDTIVTFHVLDEDMRETATLSEDEVRDLILTHELSTPLGEALEQVDVRV